jgi:hypothetical protein
MTLILHPRLPKRMQTAKTKNLKLKGKMTFWRKIAILGL